MTPVHRLLPRPDPAAALAAGLTLVALLLPWLELKPNRIAEGAGVLAHSRELGLAVALGIVGVTLPWLRRGWAAVGLGVWTGLWMALTHALARDLLAGQPETARASLGAGFWLSLLALYVFAFAAWQQARWGVLSSLGLLALGIGLGAFGLLAPTMEWRSWREQFSTELWRHLSLASSAVILALAVGIPLGVLATRGPQYGWVLGVTGFLQTIPSLALFGLLLPLLANLSQRLSLEAALAVLFVGFLMVRLFWGVGRWLALPVAVPLALLALALGGVWLNALLGPDEFRFALSAPLQESGVRGIGAAPAVLALTLYALLPVVLNVYTGLRGVSEAARDAGRGMGMSPEQLFWRVELPLALPLVLEGVRGAASLALGITTVAALIGAGGLGFFILRGIEGGAPDMVLLGAVPVIALALVTDLVLKWAGSRLRQRAGI
ncbi:MAG: ABC transporter permease [Meiothermus sp.]|nr:ABC transporter permease [Meiothermus sp.]